MSTETPLLLPHQVNKVKKTERHVKRVKAAQAREKKKLKERSSKWATTRKKFLKKNPECAACGARRGLQVHHKIPFHLRPDLELVESNLVALCEFVGGLECHELLGHGDYWKAYNPEIERHVAELRADPTALKRIRTEAKKNRRVG